MVSNFLTLTSELKHWQRSTQHDETNKEFFQKVPTAERTGSI